MKFSELIEHAIECVKTFNPIVKTLDSHADEFIKNVSIISILFILVQRSLRKSIHQTSFLRMYSLPRLFEGKSIYNHNFLFRFSQKFYLNVIHLRQIVMMLCYTKSLRICAFSALMNFK